MEGDKRHFCWCVCHQILCQLNELFLPRNNAHRFVAANQRTIHLSESNSLAALAVPLIRHREPHHL